MDGGDLVYPLPFITAVVDTLRVSVLLQNLIADFRPRRPPFLGFGLLVPVGSGNRPALVLPLFRVIDFLSLRVKNVLFFLLRAPRAALFNGAHSQHDMGVGVAAACIVDSEVGAHSCRHKMPLHILPHKGNALLPRQFAGQGKFKFSCKLGVFCFLDFLNRVP